MYTKGCWTIYHKCGQANKWALDWEYFEWNLVGKLLEEYYDVFPTNLLGLPLAKEVDYSIVLMLDVKPIFKAPYWLSFVEYEKLGQQLSDFLNKGYIKPRKSP